MYTLRRTNLLNSSSEQRAVPAEDPLHDDAAAVAGPGALHLREHPLVGADLLGIVEVDGAKAGKAPRARSLVNGPLKKKKFQDMEGIVAGTRRDQRKKKKQRANMEKLTDRD